MTSDNFSGIRLVAANEDEIRRAAIRRYVELEQSECDRFAARALAVVAVACLVAAIALVLL